MRDVLRVPHIINWTLVGVPVVLLVFFTGFHFGRNAEKKASENWLQFHLADFLEKEGDYDMAGTDIEGRPFELHFHLLPKDCNPVIWYDGKVTRAVRGGIS